MLNFTGTNFFKADGGDVNADPVNPAGGSTRFYSIQNLGAWTRQTFTGAGAFVAEAQPTLIGGLPFCGVMRLRDHAPVQDPGRAQRRQPAAPDHRRGPTTTPGSLMDQGDNVTPLGLGGVNRPGAIAYGAGGNADFDLHRRSGGTVFVRTVAAGAFAATLPGGKRPGPGDGSRQRQQLRCV